MRVTAFCLWGLRMPMRNSHKPSTLRLYRMYENVVQGKPITSH